ncbi:MAG: VCBS repeat-containing protein [Sedimentisphaerales bacterium]
MKWRCLVQKIRGILVLLMLTVAATGAGKPASPRMPVQARDTNQPDTNTVVTSDLSKYYGFGEMEIIKLDYGLRCLLVADFDGDGRNDMAIANNQKSAIELLIQKEAKGLEEQEVAVDPNDVDINAIVGTSRFHRQTLPVSQRIYALACGDLNSDGLIDLAFYGEPRGLYVILQKPGSRKGQKQKTIEWQQIKRINIEDALPSENALVCADIDNDGKKDLILAGRDAVYIVFQKQDGTLGEPVKYPVAARILGIDVGDLNGDGKNDLVIFTDDLERPIHVRMGQKTNQLGPEIRLFAESPVAAEISNIDGQSGDEIVAIDAISRRLACYKFTTDAGPAAQSKNDDWPVLFYPLAAGEGSEKRDLVVSDVDGDGLTDVVISDPGAAELLLFKQSSGVGLMEPARFPSLADSDSLSAADIDGDGKSEVAVLSVKEKVIGISKFTDGRLSFPKALDVAGEPLAMELADIDGDGSVDCVYISRSQQDTRSLRVIYDVGKQQRAPDTNNAAEVELPRLAANPQGIKVIDVDQDGLKDVLVFVKYELPILIRQTNKRKFEVVESPGAQNSLLKEATLRSISVADVDGKKGDELLIAQNNFARSMIFKNGSWKIIDQYNAKSAENRISAATAIHFDNNKKDKKPSILLLDGQKGRLQILTAGDNNAYHFEKEIDTGVWSGPAGVKILLASLTGKPAKSATPEVLLFDGEKFAIVDLPMSFIGAKSETPGNQSNFARLERKFSYETKIKDGSYGILTTGDLNGDGVVDIILVEYKNNHIEILTQNSAGNPVPAFAFKVFEGKAYRESRQPSSGVEPSQLKVADVTGDGKPDLITVIHDRIIIYPQD